MNKYLFFSILLVLGCSSKENSNIPAPNSVQFSYEIDTVQIDAGEDFLFLKHSLLSSEVSKDKRTFFNVDELGSQLEIIDLDKLVLKEKVPFEREGPDGVGPEHISNFKTMENGNFAFFNIRQMTVLNPEMQKVSKNYFYPEAFDGDTLPGKAEIVPFVRSLNVDGSQMAGFYDYFWENEILGIALIDLKTNHLKLIPTDKLDYLKDLVYTIEYENGSKSNSGEARSVNFFDNRLIIGTSAKNEVHIYDINSDSLSTKTYQSDFTSDYKKGNYMSESNSDLALELKDLEVYFGPLVYDELNKIFWRYSRESKSSNPENPDFIYVLTAFDQDFNQIHEEELNVDWTHKPTIKFIKDGMLYTYINLEDELAFVRLKSNITYELIHFSFTHSIIFL